MPVQAIETKYLLSGNVFKIDFKINGHCVELKKERKFKRFGMFFCLQLINIVPCMESFYFYCKNKEMRSFITTNKK